MMRRLRSNEDGQAIMLSVVFLVLLLGATALTIDVGAWYRAQRAAQGTADAAALAGAQALPNDTPTASTLAAQYATVNGGGVAPSDISFRSEWQPNDTVVVKVKRTTPSFFARLFSISSVDVSATAAARAGTPEAVRGVGPIVVNKLQTELSGPGCPCFHVETTLPLGKDGAPGAFGLVNLDPGSNNGVPNLAGWIQYGFDGYLPLGRYNSDPGAKFNSDNIISALNARLATELLLPVYDTLTGNGANAQYNVIGWVAFHLDSFDPGNGNNSSLTGYFTRVIWNGLQSTTNKHLPDFGVYSVSLVN
ncbi:MAG TPA: pilus assembly protein TadG-related protein [Gaiellaceae bacterium]|nr:pilus assembly protein TadG-related protein [Gaiellaceae bacterium]